MKKTLSLLLFLILWVLSCHLDPIIPESQIPVTWLIKKTVTTNQYGSVRNTIDYNYNQWGKPTQLTSSSTYGTTNYSYNYDDKGFLISISEKSSDNSSIYISPYSYNSDGKQVKGLEPYRGNGDATFEYDISGSILKIITQNTGEQIFENGKLLRITDGYTSVNADGYISKFKSSTVMYEYEYTNKKLSKTISTYNFGGAGPDYKSEQEYILSDVPFIENFKHKGLFYYDYYGKSRNVSSQKNSSYNWDKIKQIWVLSYTSNYRTDYVLGENGLIKESSFYEGGVLQSKTQYTYIKSR